jgi:hypothetical protein
VFVWFSVFCKDDFPFQVSQGVPLAPNGFVGEAYCQTWRTRRFSTAKSVGCQKLGCARGAVFDRILVDICPVFRENIG